MAVIVFTARDSVLQKPDMEEEFEVPYDESDHENIEIRDVPIQHGGSAPENQISQGGVADRSGRIAGGRQNRHIAEHISDRAENDSNEQRA